MALQSVFIILYPHSQNVPKCFKRLSGFLELAVVDVGPSHAITNALVLLDHCHVHRWSLER